MSPWAAVPELFDHLSQVPGSVHDLAARNRAETWEKFKSEQNLIDKVRNMTLAEEFARFADKLREGPDGLMSEVTFFPSGAMSMRIRFGARLFDIDYQPSQGLFFVDELPEDAGFNTGYRFSFEDFRLAEEKMQNLLQEAKNSSVNNG